VVAIDCCSSLERQAALEPMLGKIGALPEELARPKRCWPIPLFSEENGGLRAAAIEPLIAMATAAHPTICQAASPIRRPRRKTHAGRGMAHRLKRQKAGSSISAVTDPGTSVRIIKSVLDSASSCSRARQGAWRVEPRVMAWNIKRMFHPQLRLILPDAGPAAKKMAAGDMAVTTRSGRIRRPSLFCRRQSLSAFSLKPSRQAASRQAPEWSENICPTEGGTSHVYTHSPVNGGASAEGSMALEQQSPAPIAKVFCSGRR